MDMNTIESITQRMNLLVENLTSMESNHFGALRKEGLQNLMV